MLLGFLVSFLLFFWPHCDTQVWSPWLTELTHWPITNSLTQLFFIFFSCDFVAYCSLLFLFLLTFPLIDKHDRSLLLYLCCLSSSDCPLFSFLAFFKFCCFFPFLLLLKTPVLMYVMVFILFFLLSPLIFVLSIFLNVLCFVLFFCCFPFLSIPTQHYFVDAWNTFDALIVVGSIVDIAITEVNVSSPNSLPPFLPACSAIPTHTNRPSADTHLACFQMIRKTAAAQYFNLRDGWVSLADKTAIWGPIKLETTGFWRVFVVFELCFVPISDYLWTW